MLRQPNGRFRQHLQNSYSSNSSNWHVLSLPLNLCGYLTGSHASDLMQTIVGVRLLKMHFYTRSQSSERSSEDDDDGLADNLITVIPSFSSAFFSSAVVFCSICCSTSVTASHGDSNFPPPPCPIQKCWHAWPATRQRSSISRWGNERGVKKNPPIHILCFIPFLFYPFFSFLVATAWAPR